MNGLRARIVVYRALALFWGGVVRGLERIHDWWHPAHPIYICEMCDERGR